jgi:hypothetical protein
MAIKTRRNLNKFFSHTRSLFARLPKIDRRWLIIWIIIYLGFISLDIIAPSFLGTTLLKYIGIFLCLVYALQKSRRDHLLILALAFTLLSDTILMWLDANTIGVYTFCFAQFFHTARLAHTSPKFLLIYFVAIFAIFALGTFEGIPSVYCVASIYAISLLMNIHLSHKWYKSSPTSFSSRCAFFGFLLFLCCDLCVGTSYLAHAAIFPTALYPIIGFLVWIFYYPSQILLSNSSNLPKNYDIMPPNGR